MSEPARNTIELVDKLIKIRQDKTTEIQELVTDLGEIFKIHTSRLSIPELTIAIAEFSGKSVWAFQQAARTELPDDLFRMWYEATLEAAHAKLGKSPERNKHEAPSDR